MKKIIPSGAVIKQLREHLERGATQKELSHIVGVSERQLRSIENNNTPIGMSTLDRLAKALGVHRDRIAYSIDAPKLVPAADSSLTSLMADLANEQLIPRHDYDIASATTDESALFASAARCSDLVTHVEVQFTEETGAYAEELVELLSSLTWSQRDMPRQIPPREEIAMRRRIRQLLVLLKGNDVWIYHTEVNRRLPERLTVAPPDEPTTYEFRIYIAFGPPGEWGETSIRMPIDHGQPFVLPAWPSMAAPSEVSE